MGQKDKKLSAIYELILKVKDWNREWERTDSARKPIKDIDEFIIDLEEQYTVTRNQELNDIQVNFDEVKCNLNIDDYIGKNYSNTIIGDEGLVFIMSTNRAKNVLLKTQPNQKAYFYQGIDEFYNSGLWMEAKPSAHHLADEAPAHYDNSKGSIYKFCNDHGLNAWESDLIKRVVRCRKKGAFREDLEKTKFLIDLYLSEYESTK